MTKRHVCDLVYCSVVIYRTTLYCCKGSSFLKLRRKDTKKGIPLYPNLVNLKSNTMKNTVQIYGIGSALQEFTKKNTPKTAYFYPYSLSLPSLCGNEVYYFL